MERMMAPGELTPRETFESYAFLAATLAEEQMGLAEVEARLAKMEADYIGEGRTSAAAGTLMRGSDSGREAITRRASVKGLTECVRALKRAQSFFEQEVKNQW